jgi:leucyl-tRNA synthetase
VVDEEAAKDEEITLVLQINGKVRDRITMPANLNADAAKAAALANATVQRHLAGQEPRQVIYVPGRLVNIVV